MVATELNAREPAIPIIKAIAGEGSKTKTECQQSLRDTIHNNSQGGEDISKHRGHILLNYF